MLLQPSNYSQGGGVEINGDGPRSGSLERNIRVGQVV